MALSLFNYDPFFRITPFEQSLVLKKMNNDEGSTWMKIPITISEKGNQYSIQCETPGVKKEDINVKWNPEDSILSIDLEKAKRKEDKGEKTYRYEMFSEKMHRSIKLLDIDPKSISANLHSGVLNIDIAKMFQPKPQPVNISIQYF